MAIGLGLSTTGLFAQVSIENVVPENSVMIASVHNVDATMKRLERTRLYELWKHDSFASLRGDAMEDMVKELHETMRELGMDPEQLACPSGSVGIAMFPLTDPELGMPMPGLLGMADFGDRADDITELIDAAIQRAEREHGFEYEVRDVSGRDVYILNMASLQEKDEDDRPGEPHHHQFQQPDISERFDMMHLVRDGNTFMFSNSMEVVTDVIDRIDGRLDGRFADRNEFRAIRDQIGENDAYAVFLTRDAMSLVAAADPMGMAMMAGPIIQSVFGDIRGFGMGVRVDGPKAMIESRAAAYMPSGKSGLMKLVDVQSPREDIPAFVGPNAYGYNRFMFAFNEVTSVLRGIVQSNPLLQMQVGPEYDQIEPTIDQFCALLGPNIYSVNSMNRPIDVDNVHFLMAIECNDVEAFENLISEYTPMLGLEARDFLGHRIYTAEGGMMPMMMNGDTGSISLGLGGGYVMYGQTQSVEQALRAISQPDGAPSLRDEPTYQRAIGFLDDRAVSSWSYTDLVDSVEAQISVFHAAMREAMGEFAFDEMDPELAAQMRRSEKWFDKIDFDLVRQYIGPSVSQVYSTDEGFIMESYLLEGSEE